MPPISEPVEHFPQQFSNAPKLAPAKPEFATFDSDNNNTIIAIITRMTTIATHLVIPYAFK